MSYTISISRITPPTLSNILARPRLTRLIQRGRDKGFTLIVGQAAQGKSTIGALYVRNCPHATAWVNLKREDSDPINLYYLLVNALKPLVSEQDATFLLSYPGAAMGPRLETPLFHDWAQVIFDRLPPKTEIVFDGLDRLDSNAPSFRFLQILVEKIPNKMHIILLSREEPPIGIQGKKIKNAANVIGNANLAFSVSEIKAYLKTIYGIILNATTIEKLHQLSEGWIGGLILLSQILTRVPAAKREEYITEQLSDYLKIEAFKYFAEEILSSHPKAVREVYIKSAIFDVIEPDLLNAFVSMDKSERLFHEAAKKNLFITAFYDKQKGWLFRYHTLYREFLLDRLRYALSPGEQRALFARAGHLYAERNDLENAIGYFLQAGEYEQAANIMEKVGLDLVKVGRLTDLAGWLKALPPSMVQDNAWLLFFLSMTKRFTETRENIIRLEKARSLFEKKGDISGQLLALAFIIEASIFRGRDITPMAHLLEQGELLLRKASSDLVAFERATLLCQMGFGYTLRAGKFKKGYWASQNAYMLAKHLGILTLQVNALATALLALTLAGDFQTAAKVYADIEKLIGKCDYPELHSFCSINQAQLHIVKGDLEKAKLIIRAAKIEAERLGVIYIYLALLLQDLQLRPTLGEYEAAEDIGSQLYALLRPMGNSFFSGLVDLFLGANYYRKQEYSKAKEYVETAMDIVASDEAESPNHICVAHLLLGLVYYNLNQHQKAEQMFAKAFRCGHEMSCHIVLVIAHLGMALVQNSQRRLKQAAMNLRSGFQIAATNQYDFLVWISYDDFIQACILAIELNVTGAEEYAAHLLSSRLAAKAEDSLLRLSQHSNPKVRKKALAILKKIYLVSLPVIRIRTFGKFQVLRGDKPMLDHHWQRVQACNLLKAIVSHGSQNIPRDVLVEALWPRQPVRIGENNFKVTLHRLRKSLEPTMNKKFGSSYIHVKNNLVSLDATLCEVDADQFEDSVAMAESAKRRGKPRQAIKAYLRATELYSGKYMAQDLYTDWIERERVRLQNQYIDILLMLGRLYEAQGSVNKAITWYTKASAADPICEEAYQRLIVLYCHKGKPNLARKAYLRCKQALKNEIQADPEPLTESLYRNIPPTSPKP